MLLSLGFALLALAIGSLVGVLAMEYQARALNLEESEGKRQLAAEMNKIIHYMCIGAGGLTIVALILVVMHYI